MSAHKIKRLKTPVKSSHSLKAADETLLTHITSMEESTISAIRSAACSETVQASLINEINSVYREITSSKLEVKKYQQLNAKLETQNSSLQVTIKTVKQDLAHSRQMNDLEITNHRQLRKFYQLREYEWRSIVEEHRMVLEEYDRQHSTSLSKIVDLPSQLKSESIHKDSEGPSQVRSSMYSSERSIASSFRKHKPEPSSRSLERSNKSLNRSEQADPQQENYYQEMSRLYNQESRFAKKSREDVSGSERESCKLRSSFRRVEVDDFFDNIIRKTYSKYREMCVSVNEIENMEDMKKLKNANTSTRQRLFKTLKKLHFELNDENELKLFGKYVEKAVMHKYKVFRGDFAFDLLVQKLKECEKMALSSNSELSRLDKEKTEIKQEVISIKFSRTPRVRHDSASQSFRSSRNSSDIEKMSHRTLQLLLNSTIKKDPMAKKSMSDEEGLAQSLSSSHFKMRSQLPMDSSCSSEKSQYFKFGQKDGINLEGPVS